MKEQSETSERRKLKNRENFFLFILVIVLAAVCTFLISHLPDDQVSSDFGDSHAAVFEK